jgi:hypothetical protein
MPFQLGLALAHIPGWCREVGGYLRQQRQSQTAR